MKSDRRRRESVLVLPLLLILAALILTAAAIVTARQYAERKPPVTAATPETTVTAALSFPPVEHLVTDAGTEPALNGETSETEAPPADSGTDAPFPDDPPAELTWKPQAVSNAYRKDETILLFASVNQPVFEGTNTDAITRINETLHAFCLSFVEITSEDRLMAEEASEDDLFAFEPYERSADYTVFRRGGAVSVLFRISRYSGGPHSENELKAFVFDENTGKTLGLDGYLRSDKNFAERYILSLFRQKIRQTPDVFYQDAEEILPGILSLNDYYLEKDALILFVNPSILAPSAHGPQTLAVPYGKLEN